MKPLGRTAVLFASGSGMIIPAAVAVHMSSMGRGSEEKSTIPQKNVEVVSLVL